MADMWETPVTFDPGRHPAVEIDNEMNEKMQEEEERCNWLMKACFRRVNSVWRHALHGCTDSQKQKKVPTRKKMPNKWRAPAENWP